MSRYNHKHNLNKRAYLYRILFSVIVIVILVATMPFGNNSTLHYRKGEPWDEEAIIAEEEFPILKSEEQIKRDQDSLKQFYEPYLRQDVDILERQQEALRQDFSSSSGTPGYFQPHLQEKLRHIYSIGILSAKDESKFSESQPEQVRVYHDNESNVRPFSQLFTEKDAYEYLVQEDDSVYYNHNRLHGIDLMKYVTPNLTYDADKSAWQRQDVDSRLTRTNGVVMKGQKIVDKGQIVDGEIERILYSWEQHQKEHNLSTEETALRWGGRIAYATILVVLLFLYFQQFRSDYLTSLRTALLVITLSLFFCIVTYAVVLYNMESVYMVPYCVLPIMLRIFLDSRTAFITHIIVVLASAVVLTQPFPFIVTQTVAGLVAIYSLRELSQRSELFRAAVLVTLSAMLTYLCIEFVRGTTFNFQLSNFNYHPYINLMMAGVLSMLAYLLLIPIERIFGFSSIVTLVELQNVNNPLLRRLSEEANGTFNHSMQVANLAAEVANRLGARAQLVRTGALYHDIGKLENAIFFTENQKGQNPHDGLSYERSAKIIIQHVENGLKLAEKYRLPAAVRDFIATHHGRSLTKYFYVQRVKSEELRVKNNGNKAEANGNFDSSSQSSGGTSFTPHSSLESQFRYPGPKPQTLEQAILMMADAVEAASRSLPEYTEESINAMVEKIVSAQVAEGSFDECAITFREIAEAKEVLAARLRSVYHTRIKYPEG